MAIIATGAGAIVIGGVIAGAGTAVITGKLAKFADGTGIAAGGPRFDSGGTPIR